MPVEFRVLSFVGSYWLWILIGAVVLILVILLIVVLAVRAGKAKYRFRLVVEGQPPGQGKDVYRIVEGKPQYLEQVDGDIRVSPTRGPGSLARLTAIQKGVRMGLLKPEKFPKLTDMPLNVLDFDFRVRVDLDKKQDVTVRLSSAD